MNVQIRDIQAADPAAGSRMAIADGDIHPARKSDRELFPWLAKRWQDELAGIGQRYRQPYQSGPAYPKSQPNAARRDAVPPGGGKPGCDLPFMQRQHLDPNNVALGILNPLGAGQGLQNPDFCAAMCAAVNEWQIAHWTSQDSRLKGSIVVSYEDAPAAVAEIRKWAGNPNFVQVMMLSRTGEPMGNRRYWPIYEAAAEAGLPLGVHAFGYGGHPITSGGYPTYYIEEMTGHAQCCQSGLTSLVIEGVFARTPALKLVMIEAGFAWAPSLAWRLDKTWKTLKQETPHLTRAPSEYIRDHVWWTTQPMEEPEPREHLLDTIGWIGWDRLIFATDYPHWDFDDPATALPLRISKEQRQGFFLDNAKRVYGVA
ncbi:MAG: hydrolase [Acetobacteraceae bacterium SCN 69-10]|nr:MAG: hydrolase [Acetobacteraceae bacterium SCN 69-10]OJY77025.1 MAG: hydrolase [Rhodospirillales bacterium 70-18]